MASTLSIAPLSLPSWERGLKSVIAYADAGRFTSLPSWERGLKSVKKIWQTVKALSLPSWERGLKSIRFEGSSPSLCRSPRGSVD